ncbi:phosphoenolpyruvate carboxylase family protein, partial [Vibrio harveyi]
GNLSLL